MKARRKPKGTTGEGVAEEGEDKLMDLEDAGCGQRQGGAKTEICEDTQTPKQKKTYPIYRKIYYNQLVFLLTRLV